MYILHADTVLIYTVYKLVQCDNDVQQLFSHGICCRQWHIYRWAMPPLWAVNWKCSKLKCYTVPLTCQICGYFFHEYACEIALIKVRTDSKNCFPGLSRTCKDQIPRFSRTHKTRFQGLSGINSFHKHGCIRSKKCTYQISYWCNWFWNSNWLKR